MSLCVIVCVIVLSAKKWQCFGGKYIQLPVYYILVNNYSLRAPIFFYYSPIHSKVYSKSIESKRLLQCLHKVNEPHNNVQRYINLPRTPTSPTSPTTHAIQKIPKITLDNIRPCDILIVSGKRPDSDSDSDGETELNSSTATEGK